MDNGRCDGDCPGYHDAPKAGHLWFSEWHAHAKGDHRYCDDCGQTTVRCEGCGEAATECDCPIAAQLTLGGE